MAMPKIELRLQMFRGDWDQIWSQMRLLWIMEGLCRVNQTHLRQMDAFKKRGLIERGYPPLYRSGMHYETEKGTEIWPDIPSMLSGVMGKGIYPGPWGDCLPLKTLVALENGDYVYLSNIKAGDRIVGDGGITTVLKHGYTGEKTILAIRLDSEKTLRCSPNHRLFLADGTEKRAEDVRPHDILLSQKAIFHPQAGDNHKTSHFYSVVEHITEEPMSMCADITTDTGRFWLPESGLIVHNCEDFACYRVAELRELPWHYRRKNSKAKGGYEHADPRFPQTAAPDMTSGVAAWIERMAAEPVVPQPINNETSEGDAADEKSSADKSAWKGWEKVKGGIAAKPFAKWRRGPQGNYHYHALTLLPDGRLEDPSLVLGMGREEQFSTDQMAEKLRTGAAPVIIQFAKLPDVMVVDPEAPSGYAGGKAGAMNAKVLALLKKGEAPEGIDATLGPGEMAAMMSNEIELGVGEFDIDALIGWSRAEKRFVPKSDTDETRRLLGYSNH